MRHVKLTIAYDGAAFHGWQIQPGQPTIQGTIAEAASQITQEKIFIHGASRTDTGVHALAQVVHVDIPAPFLERGGTLGAFDELEWLSRSLSKKLAPDIAVWRAFVAPVGFDARHDALSRRYRYSIETDFRRDPLSRRRAWFVPGELDVAVARAQAAGIARIVTISTRVKRHA